MLPGEPVYCEVCGQRIPEDGPHECPPQRVKDFSVKSRPLRPLECELRESAYYGGKMNHVLIRRDDE